MRIRIALAILSCCFAWISARPAAGEQFGYEAVQSLILGNRDCGDNATDCVFPAVVAHYRYLHVVINDVPGYGDWQIQVAPMCSDSMPDIAGATVLPPDGYLEAVIDVGPSVAAASGQSLCFVLRGRLGYYVTYYAAYFDDSVLPDADTVYPGYKALDGRPDLPDLDVAYIHRTPEYAYDATPNAPTDGQTVTWQAHVVNSGALPSAPFTYTWSLDGRTVQQASSSYIGTLQPGESADFDLPSAWQTSPHDLRFTVVPSSVETSTANNSLTIRTTALSLGFWVERGAYDYFHQNQWQYCQQLSCLGSDSFEDWLQRQVSAWNLLFQGARYPGYAPQGIVDRVRLDQISIVPNGALPLHGGRATNTPDLLDHSIDLEWGLPARDVESTYHHMWEGPFDIDWGTIHELGHARSLADLYRFDMPVSPTPTLAVTGEDGKPVYDAADPFDPTAKLSAFTVVQPPEPFIYQNRERDLMSCPCTPSYSAYSALILNRIQGQRARCGNVNPPCNLGDWFLDIPPINRVRLLDAAGDPVPDGTVVKLFFDTGPSYAGHAFTQTESETLRVSSGEVDLGSDPFRAHGSTNVAGHNLLLLEVQAPTSDVFCFEEPADFNIAYWTGYRDARHPAVYTFQVGHQAQNDCHLQLPRALVNEPFDTSPVSSTAGLSQPLGSARRYRMLTIRLRDHADVPLPMRGRQVTVQDRTGKTLGSGVTDSRGQITIRVRSSTDEVRIDDQTDNNLTFTMPARTRSVVLTRQR